MNQLLDVMKKLLYFLMLLPLMGFVTACDDDDDVPQVSVTVDYEGAVNVDGILYVVQGEPFTINSITVTPKEGTSKATLGPVTYFWDYDVLGTTDVTPFGVTIDTSLEGLGAHLLQINSTILQVDKAMARLDIAYRINIVETVNDIPGYTPGTPDSGTDEQAVQ